METEKREKEQKVDIGGKEIVIVKVTHSMSFDKDWVLAYNPTGVKHLKGVKKYLADWLIRFVPLVKRRLTVYQWLQLMRNELDSYFMVTNRDIRECLTMELIQRQFNKEPDVIFSIPGEKYTTDCCSGYRKSPIYLYSPSPAATTFKINNTKELPGVISPIERLIDYVRDFDKSQVELPVKITV